jgi:signal transduction histidine kinase
MPLFQKFRQSLTFRVGAVFVLLLLVTTMVAVVVIRHYVKIDLEGRTRRDMISVMSRMEITLDQLRGEVSLLAQLSARASQLQEQDVLLGAKTLQITVLEESRLHGIVINEEIAGQTDTPDDEVFRRGFAGMKTVDYILKREGFDRLQIIAVTPVETGETERKVITARTALGRAFLRNQRESLGGDISLLTQKELLASSSQCMTCNQCIQEIVGKDVNWREIDLGKSVYFTMECDPDPQAAIVLPVKTFGGQTVAMAIFRSRSSEIVALRHTTWGVVGGGVAFSGAMGVAFFLLISRAIRPLRELTRLTAGISAGQYGETVPVRGEDEVGELALAFNRMSVSLKQAMEEISEWNRLLETRVVEKTQELEKVHGRMVEVEKLAAVGQLAAGVAHELNNPLSGIMGFAGVALELHKNRSPGEMTPQDTEKMIGYFRQIDVLSQRCRTIIVDMLTFARQHKDEPQEIQVNHVIHQTLAFLDNQLDKGKVTVVTDFQEELPVLVGNPLQLQQVFTNLILNAAQAMKDGGNILICTRQADSTVEAEVRDNGMGISAGDLHRIFEPFFTTKPVGKGTGLGLSVSYGIIKRHGGDILVDSEPGNGSAFTVILPITKPA